MKQTGHRPLELGPLEDERGRPASDPGALALALAEPARPSLRLQSRGARPRDGSESPFAAWLEEKGHLWTLCRACRDGVKDDPTGGKTFPRVTGATVEDAQPVWRRWVAQ